MIDHEPGWIVVLVVKTRYPSSLIASTNMRRLILAIFCLDFLPGFGVVGKQKPFHSVSGLCFEALLNARLEMFVFG